MSRRLLPLFALGVLTSQSPAQSAGAHDPSSPNAAQASPWASGTSWQPASTPRRGIHVDWGRWALMFHGFVTLAYVEDPAPRGSDAAFTTNMVMFEASRAMGPGTFMTRVMASAEPAMGRSGYPLLLQTGETADGVTPLFDRQHPHDVVMELAAAYSAALGNEMSAFVYAAPVGEPPIGPPAFMHRGSGRANPVAPISHHYLDGNHITYGVLTLGVISSGRIKLEASLFNGREPDQHRWGFESPRFDSYGARLTFNPNEHWSLQGSVAQLASPERLHPGIDVVKLTTSLMFNHPLGSGNWQAMVAFGRNKRERTSIPLPEAQRTFSPSVLSHYVSLADLGGTPADSLILVFPTQVQNALLFESALQVKSSTFFTRFESAQKDELFDPSDARHSTIFRVSKLSLGLLQDLPVPGHLRLGLGVSGSLHFLPAELHSVYGESPRSILVFSRIELR